MRRSTYLLAKLHEIYSDFHKFPDNYPRHMFHYTTAEGLNGITQTDRVWASNVRFLNDGANPNTQSLC
jgi:hypothetical protein